MQKLKGLGKQFFHIDTYIDEKNKPYNQGNTKEFY